MSEYLAEDGGFNLPPLNEMVFERSNDKTEFNRLCDVVKNLCKEILTKRGKLDHVKKIFGPKPFGTLRELRIELQTLYSSVRLQVPMASFPSATIDGLLLIPEERDQGPCEAEARAKRIEVFIKDTGLLQTPLENINEEQLAHKASTSDCETQGRSVVIFCMPNAGLFEFTALSDRRMVDLFVKSGVYVLFWNYRSYGHSTGITSMEVADLLSEYN